ncbi:uncharacterized protein LOC143036520 [Oratosquilla oratoria]|uniref:uncharacterized protein LOC143036520 n=1 Tax=Oratosquilla oratoria TaxID=337810 RepID=UPI003F773929
MAATTGNIRGMYDGIKKALGPTQSQTAPLKSATGEIITNQGQQMGRWVELYSDLYSRANTVAPSALNAIELPVMENLDAEPTLDELGKAIDSLAIGKAPERQYSSRPHQDSARSPPPVLERGTCAAGYERCQDCYPIQKQGISLLSIAGKVFARVLLIRRQKLAECVYPKSQ